MMAEQGGGKPPAQTTVSDWFKGLYVPSLEDVERLSKALGCPRCWLAFGDGPGPDDPVLRGNHPMPPPEKP